MTKLHCLTQENESIMQVMVHPSHLYVWKISEKNFTQNNESPNWHTPKLFKRLKCEFDVENNERRNWGTFSNSRYFKGKRGMLELQDGD